MKEIEKIWADYHMKLAAFIRSRVAEDAVDDLLQDVFVKIHNHIGSLRDGAKIEGWLYQITRNTIIDHYRSRQISEELPEWIEHPQPEDEEIIRKELTSCLAPMMNDLPEKYRNALQLADIENKTQKEVAELEGISLSGVKSRVQRGRGLLRVMLYDCCEFEINKHNQIVSFEKKKQGCKYC